MKNTIYFTLGVILIITTSAAINNTSSVIVVKPKLPRNTIIVSAFSTPELNEKIRPYLNRGFIVKNLSVGDGGRSVILEQY